MAVEMWIVRKRFKRFEGTRRKTRDPNIIKNTYSLHIAYTPSHTLQHKLMAEK
jgi:hypothetical protein